MSFSSFFFDSSPACFGFD